MAGGRSRRTPSVLPTLVLLLLACSEGNPAYVATIDAGIDPAPRDAAVVPDVQEHEAGGPADAGDPDAAPTDPAPDASVEAGAVDLAADGPVDGPLTSPDLAAEVPEVAVDAAPADLAAPDLPPDAPSAFSCPNDPGLALCVLFEDRTADESRNNLTINPNGVTYEVSPTGKAGKFNTQTRVEVPPSSRLDPPNAAFTMEAWIKPTRFPSNGERMGIIDYSRAYALFLHPNGDVECIVVTGSGSTETLTMANNGRIQVNQWTSVVCTADTNRLSIWVNGVERAVDSNPDTPQTGSGAETLIIGSNFSPPDPFVGSLDNIRVWLRVRTAPENLRGLGGHALPLTGFETSWVRAATPAKLRR